MKDITTAFTYDMAGLSQTAWIDRADDIGDEYGYALPIGMNNMAVFIDAGRSLLVSFENIETICSDTADSAPLGWDFVKRNGWSSLTFLARTEADWFRHPAMFGYFDRLIDDGFFDDFDTILFYGAGSAGYAAAAFSVSAPEARVLAIQPQATLDRKLARWDNRFPQSRQMDFASRFGYAPKMVETAQDVWVIHDPSVVEDAMHAGLFRGANTTHLDVPFLGPNAVKHLIKMGIFPDILEQAMAGDLDAAAFATLWRARHDYLPYLRTMMHRIEACDTHPKLLARLCRAVVKGKNRPMFAKKLEDLEAAGVVL